MYVTLTEANPTKYNQGLSGIESRRIWSQALKSMLPAPLSLDLCEINVQSYT